MDWFKVNVVAGVILLGSQLPIWAGSVGAGSNPSEIVLQRTGDTTVKVTKDGRELPAQEIQIEVVPKNSLPAPSSDPKPSQPLSGEERRELDRWRSLSRYPIHLTLINGMITMEWAGFLKSIPVEDGKINIQLSPK